MNSSPSKKFLFMSVLMIVDFAIIWVWVLNAELSTDAAIGVYIVVPFVFFLNLIVAGILFLFKKEYYLMFLVNAIISSIIMYNLFGYGIDRTIDNTYDSWEFSRNDTVFMIDKVNRYKEFAMSYSTDLGLSTEFMNGTAELQGDTLVLRTGNEHMYILKDRLYNFQGLKSAITLRVNH